MKPASVRHSKADCMCRIRLRPGSISRVVAATVSSRSAIDDQQVHDARKAKGKRLDDPVLVQEDARAVRSDLLVTGRLKSADRRKRLYSPRLDSGSALSSSQAP